MNERNLNTKWLKAAIIGSTWAAFEIIVGSFLHNLRIPFSGSMLAMASVFLLVAYKQVWKEKGIILRAGLICALMKSISPSAMIFGPMIGIFMEALIIELFALVFGRTLLGFMLAGSTAVIWALMQKVLHLLITYGFNLIEIAKSFYFYLVKVSGLDGLDGQILLLIIICVYLIFGALSAIIGYRIGRQFSYEEKDGALEINTLKSSDKYLQENPQQKYSFTYLGVIIVALVTNLYLVNANMHLEAIIAGAVFLGFCLFRYKSATRFLRKPAIWIQFAIVTILTASMWDYFTTGEYFTEKGLEVGLEMNYRAIVIIFGFSSIGVELRNPVIKSLLYKKGYSNLHDALNLGFSTLPIIIESLPKPKLIIRNRQRVVFQLLTQSINLLNHFERKK